MFFSPQRRCSICGEAIRFGSQWKYFGLISQMETGSKYFTLTNKDSTNIKFLENWNVDLGHRLSHPPPPPRLPHVFIIRILLVL